MIVMRIDADNLCGFRNFSVVFSFSKKPVHSLVDETLKGYQHFRYKKINIILGTNASGKTTLGKVIVSAFNFLKWFNTNSLKELIGSSTEKASLCMDFIPDGKTLYRLSVAMDPSENYDRQAAIVKAKLVCEKILKADNYEKCAERLKTKEEKQEFTSDFAELFKGVPGFGWMFVFNQTNSSAADKISKKSKIFPEVLKKVMMTLDSSIESVEEISSTDGDYLMKMEYQDQSILIHDGKIQDSDVSKVSSGTRAGVIIASLISSVKEDSNCFYYCDEMFSFIQTDIEEAILSLLYISLKDNDQIFFTTHNEDILDLNLPRHSFIFMKKDHLVKECPIEAIDGSAYIRKNNVSLRNSVENDLFSTRPDLNKIYEIEDL